MIIGILHWYPCGDSFGEHQFTKTSKCAHISHPKYLCIKLYETDNKSEGSYSLLTRMRNTPASHMPPSVSLFQRFVKADISFVFTLSFNFSPNFSPTTLAILNSGLRLHQLRSRRGNSSLKPWIYFSPALSLLSGKPSLLLFFITPSAAVHLTILLTRHYNLHVQRSQVR